MLHYGFPLKPSVYSARPYVRSFIISFVLRSQKITRDPAFCSFHLDLFRIEYETSAYEMEQMEQEQAQHEQAQQPQQPQPAKPAPKKHRKCCRVYWLLLKIDLKISHRRGLCFYCGLIEPLFIRLVYRIWLLLRWW